MYVRAGLSNPWSNAIFLNLCLLTTQPRALRVTSPHPQAGPVVVYTDGSYEILVGGKPYLSSVSRTPTTENEKQAILRHIVPP